MAYQYKIIVIIKSQNILEFYSRIQNIIHNVKSLFAIKIYEFMLKTLLDIIFLSIIMKKNPMPSSLHLLVYVVCGPHIALECLDKYELGCYCGAVFYSSFLSWLLSENIAKLPPF